MSLFQWEHQLFCYDWLFYKCFSVPFCRNVLTRSGYWLLITQLNCLYCTTRFLDINLTGVFFDSRVGFSPLRARDETLWIVFLNLLLRGVNSSYWLIKHVMCKKKKNPCKYHISWIVVYYCKYIGTLLRELAAEIWNSAAPLAELFYCWVYLTHLWILKWINVRCEHL